VRVDAASPAPWLSQGEPTVVHLGQSALVLEDGGGHLVVTSGAFGLAPGGIQLLPADLDRLRTELAAGARSLAHWRPSEVDQVDLRMRSVRVDPDALDTLMAAADVRRPADALDPRRQRSIAPALVRAALAGESLAGPLQRLIGAGPGSTPAGDDVVVGVLAALLATSRDTAANAIGSAVLTLLERTTSSSRLYLSAAADGRFAERVHELVKGLEGPAEASRAKRSAAGWGATSGLDLLSGILAAVDSPAVVRRAA
jgi:hypothetical protein